MAEKPILFSPWSVRQIRARLKTQTRRMFDKRALAWWAASGNELDDSGWPMVMDDLGDYERLPSPYVVGDLLWVREAWSTTDLYDGLKPSQMESGAPIRYNSDGFSTATTIGENWGRKRHGMFMPRMFSRITLKVTEVRAQRVQDISEMDAKAEGIQLRDTMCADEPLSSVSYRDQFEHLWDSVNGDGAWERNDWVFAYSFREVPRG